MTGESRPAERAKTFAGLSAVATLIFPAGTAPAKVVTTELVVLGDDALLS